mmetsp:Transcript_8060/g.33922  ORF Transcript_8060/g.33922 Transcript_8060/m.33922 type:complete len:261 (-) Transcript_8060:108-890(-)
MLRVPRVGGGEETAVLCAELLRHTSELAACVYVVLAEEVCLDGEGVQALREVRHCRSVHVLAEGLQALLAGPHEGHRCAGSDEDCVHGLAGAPDVLVAGLELGAHLVHDGCAVGHLLGVCRVGLEEVARTLRAAARDGGQRRRPAPPVHRAVHHRHQEGGCLAEDLPAACSPALLRSECADAQLIHGNPNTHEVHEHAQPHRHRSFPVALCLDWGYFFLGHANDVESPVEVLLPFFWSGKQSLVHVDGLEQVLRGPLRPS